MRTRESKPVTKNELRLVGLYLVIALARQVAHDVRTIIDWFR